MDGFDGNPGIITIAATNRVDVLDNALLRPGRFDRKITVDLPDFRGRTRILGVHARGKPLEPDVDLEAIARRTPGFSGAQLENLMNEAAISSARMDKATVGWEEIDGAVDRIMVGLEKKGAAAAQVTKQKELVAYHEAGHAIVGALMPEYDQVQKVTIIPRSNGAGGLTFFAPSDNRLESGLYSKQYLESQLAVALGGPQQGGPFMGRQLGQRRTQWGGKLMGKVEAEIERLVNNSYLTAKKILMENRELLDHLSATLVDQETVSAEEFQLMLVQFNVQTEDFKVIGEDRNRAKLPFQEMPSSPL